MQSNEPDDIELSLFYKILMKKVIFQHKIATDPMGKISPERGSINMSYLEYTEMKITKHDNSLEAKTHI